MCGSQRGVGWSELDLQDKGQDLSFELLRLPDVPKQRLIVQAVRIVKLVRCRAGMSLKIAVCIANEWIDEQGQKIVQRGL